MNSAFWPIDNFPNPIMQYVLEVLNIKTIQVIYYWDCVMLDICCFIQTTPQNELYYGICENSELKCSTLSSVI